MASTQKKPTTIRTYQNKFNKAFEEQDRNVMNESEYSVTPSDSLSLSIGQNIDSNTLLMNDKNEVEPKYIHKKYTEDLGINIKNLFFEILEMLANGKNPLPYIMNDANKQFSFAVMILILGVLMLFFSNLMI